MPQISWERSAAAASRLVVLDSAGSTNSELARRAQEEGAADWPHGSALITLDQTAGRGRLGREWRAPAGGSLAASVLLRTGEAPAAALGWLPLLAGLAMAQALEAPAAPARVVLKWPNDVLLAAAEGAQEERKVCGILAEAVAPGVIVLGAGVNLTLSAAELPTPQATSLLLASGAVPDADELLAGFLSGLLARLERLARADWDAQAAGLHREAGGGIATIGRRVRLVIPGAGAALTGRATGLDETGRLRVAVDPSGATQAFAAGDVTHLRYE